MKISTKFLIGRQNEIQTHKQTKKQNHTHTHTAGSVIMKIVTVIHRRIR